MKRKRSTHIHIFILTVAILLAQSFLIIILVNLGQLVYNIVMGGVHMGARALALIVLIGMT